MTKWVNAYIILFLLQFMAIINIKLGLFFSTASLLMSIIILYLSKKNKTTSIVHSSMFALSLLCVTGFIWSIYV